MYFLLLYLPLLFYILFKNLFNYNYYATKSILLKLTFAKSTKAKKFATYLSINICVYTMCSKIYNLLFNVTSNYKFKWKISQYF